MTSDETTNIVKTEPCVQAQCLEPHDAHEYDRFHLYNKTPTPFTAHCPGFVLPDYFKDILGLPPLIAEPVEERTLVDIIETIMTQHWDITACGCWICVEGRALGCRPGDKYAEWKHSDMKRPYVIVRKRDRSYEMEKT